MSDKKIAKAIYGPSALEVALGAVLGFFAGVLVACVYLAFKPVKAPEKEPVAGVVYYQPGTTDRVRSMQWSAKHRRFLAGNGVEVNEDELNAWVAAEFKAAPKTEGAKEAASGFLTAQTPNFRIVDGQLQVGFACRVDYFGMTKDLQVFARGNFRKDGDIFRFVPAEFYLGSCPLHKLFGLGSPLMGKLSRLHPATDELRTAWARLSDVQLEGRTLKLIMP